MTDKEKQLLLADLCTRLPYGVKVKYAIPTLLVSIKNDRDGIKVITEGTYGEHIYNIEDIKPYLRPMSSMTKEEKNYIDNRWGADNYGDIITYSSCEGGMSTVELVDIIGFQDWLNSHHFDYRHLIKKGLAIEAPEGMYN